MFSVGQIERPMFVLHENIYHENIYQPLVLQFDKRQLNLILMKLVEMTILNDTRARST